MKIKLASVVESDAKAPFSIATKLMCRREDYLLSLLHFTLNTFLIVLSVKLGSLK